MTEKTKDLEEVNIRLSLVFDKSRKN